MKKIFSMLTIITAIPATALAASDNVGGCGLGSMVFNGQSGIFAQVLAVTTNGTSGNQTFGITSGTLGCSQDGMVKSNMKTAMFIEGNKGKLAREMSVGGGETLAALSHLLGITAQDQAAFNSLTKTNVTRIFASENSSTENVVLALRDVLASDNNLSHYQTAL